MKDVIYYIIIYGLLIHNVYFLYKFRKNDNSTYRIVYASRIKDWFFAILLLLLFFVIASTVGPHVPEWMKFSLFSLLDRSGSNANIEVVDQANKISPFFTASILILMLLIFPKAAYLEEKSFRHNIISVKGAIKKNILFGLVHFLVGVPLWICFVLSIIGLGLSTRYILEYRSSGCFEKSLDASTSLHGKYNTIFLILFGIWLLNQ